MAAIAGETFRLWPATDGPASAASDTTGYSLSTEFEVTGPAKLEAFIWWCANGANTAAKTFQLYALTSQSTGNAVPGTLVTSGTLTQNTWNQVNLDAPVPLTVGQRYRAVVFFAGGSNWYSATSNGWLTGIVQGPLSAMSNAAALGNIQSGFRVSAGTIDVSNGSVGSNYWLDLLVRDATPVVNLGAAQAKDTATPLAVRKAVPLGTAVEVNAARPQRTSKSRVAGAAATEDTARGLVAAHRYSLAPAAEEATGRPARPQKTILLRTAHEGVRAGAAVGAPGLRLLPTTGTVDRAGSVTVTRRRPADVLRPSVTGPVLTSSTSGPSLTASSTTGGS